MAQKSTAQTVAAFTSLFRRDTLVENLNSEAILNLFIFANSLFSGTFDSRTKAINSCRVSSVKDSAPERPNLFDQYGLAFVICPFAGREFD